MRSFRFPLVVLACAALFPGCSDDAPEVPLGEQLRSATGVEWNVHTSEQGDVRMLVPSRPVRLGEGSAEQQLRDFFDKYATALHFDTSTQLDAATTFVSPLDGATEVRIHQRTRSTTVDILDTDAIAVFTSNNELLYMFPGFLRGLAELNLTPSVPERTAREIATAAMEAECKPLSGSMSIESIDLAVGRNAAAPPRLAWRARFSGASANCAAPEVHVDAHSGDMFDLRSGVTHAEKPVSQLAGGARFYENPSDPLDIKEVRATEISRTGNSLYQMRTQLGQISVVSTFYENKNSEFMFETTKPGDWDTDFAPKGAAVDAQSNLLKVLAYYDSNFSKLGPKYLSPGTFTIINHDETVRSNAASSPGIGGGYRMKCGDIGPLNPNQLRPMCSALDMVGHEVTHRITAATSGLLYRGESGALNESFSDVMGAAAERALEVADDRRNFTMGEASFSTVSGGIQEGGFWRDMAHPETKKDPGVYSNRLACAAGEKPDDGNDQCWVHRNSGIPNRSFALMVSGGSYNSVRVPSGIGWDRAVQLWYATITRLPPDATMKDAARAQIATQWYYDFAKNPYAPATGTFSVGCAWAATGVINADDVPVGMDKLVCGTAPASDIPISSCAGHTSGYICNSQVPSSAIKCVNGKSGAPVWCKGASKKCKHPSTQDWTAKLTSSGELACE